MNALVLTGDLWFDIIGLAYDMLVPHLKNLKRAKNIIREREKMHKVELDKATKAPNGVVVSDDMYEEIYDRTDGITVLEMDYISTAIRTNNWINYSLYYMTNDNAKLLKANKPCRELVNAISNLAGFGIVYTGSGIADLNEYDIKNKYHKPGSKFLLILEELKNKLADPDFISQMNLRKEKLNREKQVSLLGVNSTYSGNFTKDEDGYLHPVFFTTPTSSTSQEFTIEKQGDDIDEVTLYKLEKSLKETGLLPLHDQYSYNRAYNGMINLTIYRSNSYNTPEYFLIDDGMLMGGEKLSICGYFTRTDGYVGNVFVEIDKHKDIVFNILNNSFYQLNPNEVQTALSDMLMPEIYSMIDFSNTPWFDYLNMNEKIDLNTNLMNIINFMKADPNLSLTGYPRLRFNSYQDANNFVLVSDKYVKSPLKDYNITSSVVADGLSFKVVNGQITQEFWNVPNMRTVG